MAKMVKSGTFVLLLAHFAKSEVAQNSAQSLECTPEGRPKVTLISNSSCWT